jgi:hypothetical protein
MLKVKLKSLCQTNSLPRKLMKVKLKSLYQTNRLSRKLMKLSETFLFYFETVAKKVKKIKTKELIHFLNHDIHFVHHFTLSKSLAAFQESILQKIMPFFN